MVISYIFLTMQQNRKNSSTVVPNSLAKLNANVNVGSYIVSITLIVSNNIDM